MRNLLVIALALAVSGCVSESAEDDTEAAPTDSSTKPVVREVRGAAPWFDYERDTFRAYAMSAQPGAHPCVWENAGVTEVYFTNMPLGSTGFAGAVPAGTSRIEATLNWELEDSAMTHLVLGYQPAGSDIPFETDWIPNGQPTILETVPSESSGTWTFWACAGKEGGRFEDDPTKGPRSFPGELEYLIRVLPPGAE